MKNKIKLLLATLVFLCVSVSVSAQSGECGDSITWSFNEETGVLSFEGSGEMPPDCTPWKELEYTSVVIGDGIESISKGAFIGKAGLESVTIAPSVKRIGYDAFSQTGLTSADMPDGLEYIDDYAFFDCANLASVTIPPSVKHIGTGAFDGTNIKSVYITDLAAWCNIEFESNPLQNTNYWNESSAGATLYINGEPATELTIPDGVTGINANAFKYYTGLESVTLPEGLEYIGGNAFSGCTGLTSVDIPDGVKHIGDCAFYDCANLASLTLPEGLEYIGYTAFDRTDLQGGEEDYVYDDVNEIPYNVLYIGDYLIFARGDYELPSSDGELNSNGKYDFTFDIKEGTRLIAGGAFAGEDAITGVTIPSSVERICDGAFKGCGVLKSITVPSSTKYIGKDAFSYCGSLGYAVLPEGLECIEDNTFAHCYELKDVSVPESVVYIGKNAFEECAIESVKIPEGVEYISDYTFADCGELKKVELPEGLKTICKSAFSNCNLLESVELPDGLEYIGENAFSESGLTHAVIPSGVRVLLNDTFYDCDDLRFVIIQAGITCVGNNAFLSCDSLEAVFVPASMKEFGNRAFDLCCTEVTFYYSSDENSWNKIIFGNYALPDKYKAEYNYKGTKSFVSEDETKVEVNPINIDEGVTVFAAFYDGNALADTKKGTYDGKTLKFATDKYYDKIKVMTWENLTDIAPVCEVESIDMFDTTETGKCGDSVYWQYDAETEVLTIRGKGDMYDYGYTASGEKKQAPWDNYRCSEVIIKEGVTSVGAYAFGGLTARDNVTEKLYLPKSVKRIGIYAFVNPESEVYECAFDGVYISDLAAWCGIEFENFASNPIFDGNTDLYINGKIAYDIAIPDGTEKIGVGAFAGMSKLNSVTIPSSVKSIGEYAFEYCENLYTVKIADGVEEIGVGAFWGCGYLGRITIPGSVKRIGNSAFANCSKLSDVTIKNGVEEIGAGAFYYCNEYVMQSLVIPESVKSIGEYAFYMCGIDSITFEGGVQTIGEEAFKLSCNGCGVYINDLADWCAVDFGDNYANPLANNGCLYLKGECVDTLTISENVTSIGNYAFYGADIDDVILCGNIAHIGDDAFAGTGFFENESNWISETDEKGTENKFLYSGDYLISAGFGGTNLTPESLKDGIKLIAGGAFKQSINLESAEIPESVKSIGEGAFSGCSVLARVKIPEGVKLYTERMFEGCESLLTLSTGAGGENFALPENLDEIGANAFAECISLTGIKLPDGIKSIGDGAFYNCLSLEEISIPESVKSIGEGAFASCAGLEKITIANGVEKIGAYAFYNCAALESITIPESVAELGMETFYGCADLADVSLLCDIEEIPTNLFMNCGRVTYITLPENVKRIGDGAFKNCTNLVEIVIPDGAEYIGDYAFAECDILCDVLMPTSVKHIGDYAFYGGFPNHIFYKGSEDEWNKISIGMGCIPADAKVIFNAEKLPDPV